MNQYMKVAVDAITAQPNVTAERERLVEVHCVLIQIVDDIIIGHDVAEDALGDSFEHVRRAVHELQEARRTSGM